MEHSPNEWPFSIAMSNFPGGCSDSYGFLLDDAKDDQNLTLAHVTNPDQVHEVHQVHGSTISIIVNE